MNPNQLLKEYIKEQDMKSLNFKSKFDIYALIKLFKNTEDIRYKDMLQHSLTDILDDDSKLKSSYLNMENIFYGNILMFFYELTGEIKYKEAMNEYYQLFWNDIDNARDNSLFLGNKHELKFESIYHAIPFIMNYETKYNKKERYIKIISILINIRDDYFNEESGIYAITKEESESNLSVNVQLLNNNILYLLTLLETFESTSEEIYEHYRKLMELFKELFKGILESLEENHEVSAPFVFMIAYAIKTANNLGILLTEKYEKISDRLVYSVTDAFKVTSTEEEI